MVIDRRRFIAGAPRLGAGVLGVSAPFLARAGFAATPLHTLKLTFADSQAHPIYDVLKRFAADVARRTGGAAEVQVFSLGQLGSGTNILTGLQTGIIDLCAHTSGFIDTVVPKMQVVDLPFLFSEASAAERVLDGPIGRELFDAMPAKGIYGLGYGHWGWRVVSSVERKLPAPADMKGLKVRVQPGAVFAAMFRTLGANPVAIDLTEVYLALSQRTVDAIETPMISVIAGKHFEVVKTINLTNHVYNAGALLASKAKLDALPPEIREAVRAAAVELTPDWRATVAKASTAAQDTLKQKGLTVTTVDRAAYRQQVEPVYKQFRGTLGADLVDRVLKEAGSA